jgi:hypothetical protein
MTESSIQADTGLCLEHLVRRQLMPASRSAAREARRPGVSLISSMRAVMDYDYALCRVVALGVTFGQQQRDLGILRPRARP